MSFRKRILNHEGVERLEDAKALVDCRIMGAEDEKENN